MDNRLSIIFFTTLFLSLITLFYTLSLTPIYRATTSIKIDIEADKLICKIVVATASSGSDIDVFASESIQADASSGADIKCKGKPKNVNIEKSSGGSVDIEK